MLLVQTTLGLSPIEGMGVFAAEFIPKGKPTWRFMHGLDQILSMDLVMTMQEPIRSGLQRYSYLDRKTGLYIYCLDNARFVNHSDTPNTEGQYPTNDPFGQDVATRDIQIGEELTCNYRDFDLEHSRKLSPGL